MSTQAIFDLLSSRDVAERSIQRIPSGPKSNCYFILNLGKELTDYETASNHRMKVQDRLRDGTGAWDDMNVCNSCCFLLENGVLKSVKMNKKKTPHFDLRAHRATYISQGSHDVPSRKSVVWFWNSELSPAPGMAVVAYLGPAYTPRPHGNSKHTSAPYQRAPHESIASYSHRHQESTLSVYKHKIPPHDRQQEANAIADIANDPFSDPVVPLPPPRMHAIPLLPLEYFHIFRIDFKTPRTCII